MKKLTVILSLAMTSLAYAGGGYEKPSPWSAKGVSVGGAMSSNATGSDAVFFNPAGLHSKNKREIQLGLSCATGDVSAPVVESGKSLNIDDTTVCAPGLVGSYRYNDKLSFGLGAYALAGIGMKYSNIDLSGYSSDLSSYKPNSYSELGVMETNLSVAYRVTDALSFGVSVKGQFAQAGFSQTTLSNAQNLGAYMVPDGTPLAASETEFKDLEGSEMGSYTLGLLYKKERWGVGVTYRNEVKVDVKGKTTGSVAYTTTGAALTNAASGGAFNPTPGQSYALTGSDVTLSTYLPQQVKVDGHYKLNSNNTVFLGYAWTDYSRNQALKVSGGTLTNPNTGEQIAIPDVQTKWNDMHDFKLGYENTSFSGLAIRGGYTYTTQVTNNDYAGPTLATPAAFHHFALGVGKTYSVGESKTLEVNLALEHYRSKGTGRQVSQELDSSSRTPEISGDYETKVSAAMVGVTYGF